MKCPLRLVLIMTLTLLATHANASFTQYSSPAFGPNTITYDSTQNLYWLSPKVTLGLSYDQVSQLLQTDQAFAGYRYATTAELSSLFSEFRIPDINVYGTGSYGTTANVSGVTALQAFLGSTYSQMTAGVTEISTDGFVGAPYLSPVNNFISVYLGSADLWNGVLINNTPTSFAYAATDLSSSLPSDSYSGIGSWLVSAVPEPDSYVLILVGLGLIGLAGRRKTRNSGPALVE